MSKTQKSLNRNYIVIESWMVSQLELKGNSLLIYALIYGFSQTDKQVCTCGIDYMRAWTNSSKQGVLNALEQLTAAGLIERVEETEGDGRRTAYRAIGQESRPNLSEKIGQQSVPKSMKKVKKVDLKIGQQSCENRSTKFRAYKDNINNYNTDLSVSHSAPARADGTDGRTKEKLFFAECIKNQLKSLDIIEKADMIQRLTDITDQLLRLKTVTIGGLEIDSVEVLKAIFDLFRDGTYERLNDALFVGIRSDVKNKFGYTVAALYNAAKQF